MDATVRQRDGTRSGRSYRAVGRVAIVAASALLAIGSFVPSVSAASPRTYYLRSALGSYQLDSAAAINAGMLWCAGQPTGSTASPTRPPAADAAIAEAGGHPGPYCLGAPLWPSWGLTTAYADAVTSICVDLYMSGTTNRIYMYLISRSGISTSTRVVAALQPRVLNGVQRLQQRVTFSRPIYAGFAIGVSTVEPHWPSGAYPSLSIRYDSVAFPSSVTFNCSA